MIKYDSRFIDKLKEDPELRTAIQDKNFSHIYDYLIRVNTERSMFTQFCYDVLKVDPLEYLDDIPYEFSCFRDITSFNIPDHVKEIGHGAFWKCTSLKSMVIPDGVEVIGNNAFEGCVDLKKVTIPNTVTKIGDCAFIRCTELNTIIFKGTWDEWVSVDVGWRWHEGVPTSCVIQCSDRRTTF